LLVRGGLAMDCQGSTVLDLRGEVCPYTFVKSKLVMEQMDPGQVLEVIVDFPPAVRNVARSMEMEGHEVIHVEALDSKAWKIILRKGQD
jgi:tRNA 2-thiouridine synthesizing protein A